MKRITLTLATCLALYASQLLAGGPAEKFEKLKTLAGSWQGTNYQGKPVTAIYEVVSNGSAVMERLQNEGELDMVTMYHLDGENLMMTHYCSAMNQPRMRAELSDDANVVKFAMFDITNLASKDAGHMEGMVLNYKDDDHIVHEWTFVDKGKPMTAPITLERQKMSTK